MNIGCHVSIAGGITNAPKNGHDLGCEVIQIFTRSPQGGPAPILTNEICEKFKNQELKFKIEEAYVHTPYYINLASASNRIRYGSVKAIRDELERANLLGAKYVMTHLGSGKDLGHKEAMKKTVEMLKKTLEGYNGTTKLLLENSAGAGEIIGDDLKELAKIILGVNSSSIAGICLDTQHSFASGYDWKNFAATLNKIEGEIGLETIKLIHANDSGSACGSKRDRHEHVGRGKIGLEAFREIVGFARARDIDIICETEHPGVIDDIKFLKSLRDS